MVVVALKQAIIVHRRFDVFVDIWCRRKSCFISLITLKKNRTTMHFLEFATYKLEIFLYCGLYGVAGTDFLFGQY